MLRDLGALMDFSNACNKRFEELRKLASGKPLRKRVSLSKDRLKTPQTSTTVHSEGVVINGFFEETYTTEVWGSCEYLVPHNYVLPQMDGETLSQLSERLAGGITSHEALATLWELTPWSWFAYWFFKIGDTISALNNTLGLRWGRICVMRHSLGVVTYTIDQSTVPDWVTISGPLSATFDRKERHPTFPIIPLPFLSLPILNAGQLSILASLAVSKL
jgi:hypothetical protein